ncbi:MAG TPA: iron donor protein CyaY [Candidatus Binatia bacterium]|nr:iron donor protein CyaY [Candidatus Binatia bacterium]
MDEQEYLRAADACLERAASWLGTFEDLDVTTSDGLVTMEFEDGARFVLNRQSAARQIWLAAGARAWHYRWDESAGAWVDDRDGHELFGRLATEVGEKLGVRLDAPS